MEKDTKKYYSLRGAKQFMSESGEPYTKSVLFGYTKILRNHRDVVYAMPLFDYLILVVMVTAFGSIVPFGVVFLIRNIAGQI